MKIIAEFRGPMISRKWRRLYQGNFTQVTTRSILDWTENQMDNAGEYPRMKRKVLSVMVEMLQNVVRHSNYDFDDYYLPAMCWIIRQPKSYVIVSGNVIHQSQVDITREKLAYINTLDKAGLKKRYQEVIASPSVPGKTAGLGLLDLARKSRERLMSHFCDLSGTHSCFFLAVNISLAA